VTIWFIEPLCSYEIEPPKLASVLKFRKLSRTLILNIGILFSRSSQLFLLRHFLCSTTFFTATCEATRHQSSFNTKAWLYRHLLGLLEWMIFFLLRFIRFITRLKQPLYVNQLYPEFPFIPSRPIAPDFKCFHHFHSLHANEHDCKTWMFFWARSVVDKKRLVPLAKYSSCFTSRSTSLTFRLWKTVRGTDWELLNDPSYWKYS
jgi:hypothetical protein